MYGSRNVVLHYVPQKRKDFQSIGHGSVDGPGQRAADGHLTMGEDTSSPKVSILPFSVAVG